MICWGFNHFLRVVKRKRRHERSAKGRRLQRLLELFIQILSEALLKPKLQAMLTILNAVAKQDVGTLVNFVKKARIMLFKMAM